MSHTRILTAIAIILAASALVSAKDARLFQTVEWSFDNSSFPGNPYDLDAKATFKLAGEDIEITTGLYYDGNGKWKLRFTPTLVGDWSFVTASDDPDLNGRKGRVRALANPGADGFIRPLGSRWSRSGTDRVFSPQYIMYTSPDVFYDDPDRIEADIAEFIESHGFNGFNTYVACRWFDIEKTRSNEIESADPNPDPRTFEALELLIRKATQAGAVVHIWAWGDEQRRMTPHRWGLNGKVDRRLQRYIAARLAPLPGWTMCYGFDLQEWVDDDGLRTWHDYMHEHMGWDHLLGGRSPGLTQICPGLDYSSYQQHRPTYETYVKAIEQYPHKPTFLEDRFRVRKNVYPDKDYTFEMTRRGLWHSTMAGGAANIWGNLLDPRPDGMSHPYPNKHQIKTWSLFWRRRFTADLQRSAISNGRSLIAPSKDVAVEAGRKVLPIKTVICYKEDTESITMDLDAMKQPLKAVAVDTKAPYKEIPIPNLKAKPAQTFHAPKESDWAIAITGKN